MLKAVHRIPCLIPAMLDVIVSGIYSGELYATAVLLQPQKCRIGPRQQQARCANAAIKIKQRAGQGILPGFLRAVGREQALCRLRKHLRAAGVHLKKRGRVQGKVHSIQGQEQTRSLGVFPASVIQGLHALFTKGKGIGGGAFFVDKGRQLGK